MVEVHEFRDQEAAYRAWIAIHRDGFVLNLRRRPTTSYAVLHRAHCRSISVPHTAPGGFTERGYMKIRSPQIDPLQEVMKGLALAEGRSFAGGDELFSKRCTLCSPW